MYKHQDSQDLQPGGDQTDPTEADGAVGDEITLFRRYPNTRI